MPQRVPVQYTEFNFQIYLWKEHHMHYVSYNTEISFILSEIDVKHSSNDVNGRNCTVVEICF